MNVEETTHKADMERVLNSGFDKRPNKLCKVRVHRVTTTPSPTSGLERMRVHRSRARHMRNIKGGKRKKLTCEAIFVYRWPPSPAATGLLCCRQSGSRGRGERTPIPRPASLRPTASSHRHIANRSSRSM